jgi:thiol-disulfide isomerase/thioredoxin
LHYKKFQVEGDDQIKIKSLKPYKILVITEPWCGDSLALLPLIRKIAEINGNWELKVLLRDSNLELMDHFLTRSVRGIPVFLFLDEEGECKFKWGPRPEAAAQIFENHRSDIEENKIEKKDVIKKIRVFYAKDRGKATLAELMEVFSENEAVEIV